MVPLLVATTPKNAGQAGVVDRFLRTRSTASYLRGADMAENVPRNEKELIRTRAVLNRILNRVLNRNTIRDVLHCLQVLYPH